jgi:Tol biopolymer transport system component
VAEVPGAIIGRYKLLEKIGEGGMAVVYMAEQEQPIRRKVALKIIKLGMDTRQVIARFEAERQALALMDHPSIAKVLDAGATETGRPYFVMELVQGISITEYCEKNSLSTKDRLTLFLQVCHAVQHAHQKGIIHRDLKPSNVMVTHHDGKPVPKVIDFGIAKATNQKLTEKTLFTRYAHLIGTPAYMSPEQAELSDLDIDTRSDIYSLGVLLYELLTGTTPFSEEELRQAGYLEMQRVIREQEPVKPSTRIKTALRGASVPARPKTLCGDARPTKTFTGGTPVLREVRGDLDWIVMKSLEKDRVRRYETASSLAEDIRRHLEHEPVLARGPGAAYRLHKFLRRHRVQTLIGLTAAILMAIAAVVLLQWSRDRQRLAEAAGIQHQVQALQDREILSQARKQYAQGQRETALKTIQRIFASPHAGGEARFLGAGILAEDGRAKEAMALLDELVGERAEIAGAAHALLARVLWESQSAKGEKSQEIEEHRRQAEALLPETAEAYFLRAMTAVTIKEQLAFLDQALQLASRDPDPLNPINYESHRLRAFLYYASRKYERAERDAFAMTILRPRDPLGYSLRALALRESGQYQEAIAAYDGALTLVQKDDPQYFDLTAQRVETLLRMGSHRPALAAAQEALRFWPDRPIFEYDLFAAHTALGDYEAAAALFARITSPGPEARRPFENWCAKYIFDSLQAGRPWHPADRTPGGAAFLPLVEAEETYQHLAAKAKRVIADGFAARWSADGKKLALSMGFPGNNGVAVYDPATGETELLLVPGRAPAWSPDGRYIAFGRDCQALRVPEFATAERQSKPRPQVEEEVWVMKADGTGPRRLARGGSPSWSQDSQGVYYHSRGDNALYSIAVEGPDATGKRIMACSNPWPSVSPDGQRVAYLETGLLKVQDLASGTLVAQWPAPPGTWGGAAWSPAGRELCMGANAGAENRMGLWVYRLGASEPLKILDSHIAAAAWAPDGTKLVFHLEAPYFEIWTADLDPKVSTIETLGPAQTINEHFRDMVTLYTRRIKADPLDASAYAKRAGYYDALHNRAEVNADMRRWSALANHGISVGWRFGRARTLMRSIAGPLGYQLVVFLERQEDGMEQLRIACGQKGRCEMRVFEIPMLAISLLGLSLLSGLDTPVAHADFAFGELVEVHTALPFLTGETFVSCFSSDDREMFLMSDRGGGQGGFDLWVSKRASADADWGPPANLGPVVNSAKGDYIPSLSADGLELYFASDRSGNNDIYLARRATPTSPWGPPTSLGPNVNSTALEYAPSVSSDGLELYFQSGRPGGYGRWDLYVSKRATRNDPWGNPVNLGAAVNSPADEAGTWFSPDGLVLIFQDGATPRPGGYGSGDLWMTRRASRSAPWEPAVNLGPVVNGPTRDCLACFAADGSALYFVNDIGYWKAPILPILDFNSDGKVDAKDLLLMTQHWGENDPRYDVGPFAWGDGIVDAQDWVVLVEAIGGSGFGLDPKPYAAEVPRDVVLTWTPVPFSPSYDVYFGTSQAAVNSANRANPQGVLVSQGQTAPLYQPTGSLEYNGVYYWRIDFVTSGPTPTIYQGPVLRFTTEAFAYPIQNVTAKASSVQGTMGPDKTVDGSGLDQNDGHCAEGKDMWLSTGVSPHWIQYQFDKVYALHELWVWNSNSAVEPFIGFGAKTVKIEYSLDGTTWTALANVPEFARAPGKSGYVHNTTVSFGGISARYVKLTIERGWGTTPSVGLSEVRFFYIPTASAPKP